MCTLPASFTAAGVLLATGRLGPHAPSRTLAASFTLAGTVCITGRLGLHAPSLTLPESRVSRAGTFVVCMTLSKGVDRAGIGVDTSTYTAVRKRKAKQQPAVAVAINSSTTPGL